MKTVLTAGSFDLIHVGHIELLKKSKALGDKLIVGLSTDELVRKQKGVAPIIPFKQRKQMVEAIKYVDSVIPQYKILEVSFIQKLMPNIITIGTDWQGKYLKGLDWAINNGITIIYLDYTTGVSTTKIKETIVKNSYKIIKAQLQRELNKFSEDSNG